MNIEIVKIHLDNKDSNEESNIESVEVLDGGIYSVETIIKYIDFGTLFFFKGADSNNNNIEVVKPENSDPYIRAMVDETPLSDLKKDNLLSLPRF